MVAEINREKLRVCRWRSGLNLMMLRFSFLHFSQRAMLRFSELELKEKEGGREEEEEEEKEGITAAAAAAAAGEMELADGQPGDEGRKDEDKAEEEEGRKKEGGGGWESCQQSEGRRGGGGRTPSVDATEAPRGKRIYSKLCRMTCTLTH